MLRSSNIQDLDAAGAVVDPGFAFAMRSCSLLKVDPQVLHRHPVMGVRAAFAVLIREGLNDKPSSPPQSRHRRFATSPLFPISSFRIPAPASWPGQIVMFSLQELDVFGLQTFRSFGHVELYGCAFLKALEAGRLNRGEMDEYVLSVSAAQKAVPFRIVKPLHCSLFHLGNTCFFEISC
jgi:hypothetical protein